MADIDAGKVKDLWKKGQDAQRRLITNYQINAAFVGGDQWLSADENNRITQAQRDPDRVRATMNRLLPAMRSLMAKLHKRPLTWEVAPPSADDASIQKARTAEAVLEATAVDQAWEDLRTEADWVTFKGGTGILSVDWDAAGGVPLTETDDGKPVGTGEVVLMVSGIESAVVEPGARNARRARWWIRGVALPPEEAKDTYKLNDVPQADSGATDSQITDLTRKQTGKADLTMVLTYYRRPTPTDEGEMAVVIGNTVVQKGPWPFPWRDHLNLAVQRETPIEKKWMGDTVLTSAVPIQTAYNAAWSSLLEHVKLAGNARGLMPEENADLIDEMDDDPGAWLQYRQGFAPSYLSPPQLPQWVIDSPAMLRRELDDELGTQDITRGAAPSNIESGLGISILAEQADTPIAQMAAESSRAWSEIATDVLELYASKATETRTATLRQEGRPDEGVQWRGADLKGLRARIPQDAILPKSQASQEALGVKLWEMGAVTDPAVLAAIANLPNKDSFIRAIDPDAAKAADENADMAVGKKPDLQTFDNHETHIRVHNVFRKGRRYRSMKDAQRKDYDKHVTEHEDAAREEQVQVAGEQMVSPLGAPPPLASEADLAAAAMGAAPDAGMPEEQMAMSPDGAGTMPPMNGEMP